MTLSFEGNPRTQGHEILSRKARDLRAAHGEDFVILACTILIHIQSVTDGQTDRQTDAQTMACLLYTSPSPRDRTRSRMPSSA